MVVHLLGLRRGGGRWWWQPISFPYASVRVFSHGFFSVLSSPVLSLCSRSSRFATLGRGGSREFRGDYFLCPLSFGSLSHCQLSHPLLLFWGGGENILLSFIIMHSCNPNDRFDLWISSHCWAKIYLCFRRLQRSKLCWLGRLKQFYFSY